MGLRNRTSPLCDVSMSMDDEDGIVKVADFTLGDTTREVEVLPTED